jgi:hypothetical protein
MPPELTGPAHDGSGASVLSIERLADDLAERILDVLQELHRQRQIVADLLRHLGAKGVCKGARCQQTILFICHRNGRITPYNLDGTSHYSTCVDREEFHRRRT